MRKLRAIGVTAAVVLSLSTSVAAQTTDPQFRSDVERLLRVTGAERMGAQMASLISGQMIDGFRRSQPDVPDRAIEIVKEVMDSEFSKAFVGPDGLQARIVDIYARHFTHDEVIVLLNFYTTPVGQKAISEMPVLMQESAAAGQAWGDANMSRIGDVLRQRLEAEGFVK